MSKIRARPDDQQRRSRPGIGFEIPTGILPPNLDLLAPEQLHFGDFGAIICRLGAVCQAKITRADLIEAIHQRIGLSRIKCGELLEFVLKEITDCLERGETVKPSSFGSFVVRKKGQRIGRNPKTGREVPISARRVMMFKPSNTLKLRINFGPEWWQRRR